MVGQKLKKNKFMNNILIKISILGNRLFESYFTLFFDTISIHFKISNIEI